jgi:Zn-finger nucleic acid-binding protein
MEGNSTAAASRSRHMELTCPKCHGAMRTYERNGVHVDQCSDCRGIFLDRGELDRLVDAENTWHGGAQSEPRGREDRPDESATHQRSAAAHGTSGAGLSGVVGDVLRQVQGSKSSSHRQSEYGHPRRKKESFLSDLFG